MHIRSKVATEIAGRETEDLTQEVFVRLLHQPDQNSGHTIYGYVFTIAANLLRDRAKRPVRDYS
jgi:DNA-directed RNA polymerase specialized sigma24 family protein